MSTEAVESGAYSMEVPVLDGVRVSMQYLTLSIEGPLGKISREFLHTGLKIVLEDNAIRVISLNRGRRFKARVGTVAKLIRNVMEDVLHGYMVKLKIVYSHFPVTVKYDRATGVVSIHNFIGEKSPRKFRIPYQNIDIQVSGQDIIVTGIDRNEVTQVAAMFEQATKIKDKDQRIYIDGIYIFEKGPWRK